MSYKSHLFVCTNSPDKPGKCGHKGSENIRRDLKERCKEMFGKDVRVSSSGCLGYCERGIAAVVYPKTDWHFDLQDDTAAREELLNAVTDSLKPAR